MFWKRARVCVRLRDLNWGLELERANGRGRARRGSFRPFVGGVGGGGVGVCELHELVADGADVGEFGAYPQQTGAICVSFSLTRSFQVRFGLRTVQPTRTGYVAFQNTLHRHSPRHQSHPLSKTNGILNTVVETPLGAEALARCALGVEFRARLGALGVGTALGRGVRVRELGRRFPLERGQSRDALRDLRRQPRRRLEIRGVTCGKGARRTT